MRSLAQKMTAVSWIYFHFSTYLGLYFLFHPNPVQIALLLGVDSIALAIIIKFERKWISHFHPYGAHFYPELDIDWARSLSENDKVSFLVALSRFPRWFSGYCLASTVAKAIPAFLVIIFIWAAPGQRGEYFAKCLGIFLVINACFWGITFIESHRYFSSAMMRLEPPSNWLSIFESLKKGRTGYSESEFRISESLVLLSTFLFVSFSQWNIATSSYATGRSGEAHAIDIFMVAISGFLLLGRVLYLHRSYFYGGLAEIFSAAEKLDLNSARNFVPFHSAPALMEFEVAFNLLIDRVVLYRQELNHWVLYQAEQSRFRALGEISALVAHDLSNPLQVLQHCISELQEDPSLIHQPQVLNQLEANVARANELVKSLRASFRNSPEIAEGCRFGDVWRETLRLLEAQYFSRKFHSIRFTFDSGLTEQPLQLSRPDLIHILSNLLSNAIKNLLDNRISEPRISVEQVRESRSGYIAIALQDNGTGLSQGVFENLTSIDHPQVLKTPVKRGLGLRLTCRLAESYGGSVKVDGAYGGGTRILVRFPAASKSHRKPEENTNFPISPPANRPLKPWDESSLVD